MTGAEWALVIRRGIAEDAERAFLCGWWRLSVPVAAGDGCRNCGELVQKKGLGACAPGPLAWDRLRVVQVWRLAFGGADRRLWLPAMGPGAVDLWPGLLAVGAGPG